MIDSSNQNSQPLKDRCSKVFSWLKKVARREGPVVIAYLSMVAGAAAFCLIIDQVWGTNFLDYSAPVIFIPFIHLSKVFPRLKPKRRQPWLLYIACWFREGFWASATFVPHLSKATLSLRRLLKNLEEK